LELLSSFSQFNLHQLFQNKTPNEAEISTEIYTDLLGYEVLLAQSYNVRTPCYYAGSGGNDATYFTTCIFV